jgi:FkbM family methyltransferase
MENREKIKRSMSRNENVSMLDNIVSILSYLKVNVYAFHRYRKVYRNYLHVVTGILKNRYPIKAMVKSNGRILSLHNHPEAYYVTSLIINGFHFDLSSDSVTTTITNEGSGTSLVMRGAVHNGDVISIFKENIYSKLPINGKTIIDVGANIGDSSIYFALKGAKRVIGIEPFPKNYEIARSNVELNGLSDKVTLLLAGCGGHGGNITVDNSYESCANSQLTGNAKSGAKIPLMTLKEILTEFQLTNEDIILKLDCEGCEYDVVLSSASVLTQFSHILIEYHYGYKDLLESLKKLGFRVSHTRPVYEPIHKYRKGYIVAHRS